MQTEKLSPFIEQARWVNHPFKLASREFCDSKPSEVVVAIPLDFVAFGQNYPIVQISGPCLVENEEMIVETALRVKAAGASFLRGGA
jgi:3-deoxy-7-phosphoheptulonate synthase